MLWSSLIVLRILVQLSLGLKPVCGLGRSRSQTTWITAMGKGVGSTTACQWMAALSCICTWQTIELSFIMVVTASASMADCQCNYNFRKWRQIKCPFNKTAQQRLSSLAFVSMACKAARVCWVLRWHSTSIYPQKSSKKRHPHWNKVGSIDVLEDYLKPLMHRQGDQ